MNSLERVLATLAGEPVDHRAYTLMLSLYGARLTGASLLEYYTDPEAYAAGQGAVREAFEPDLLFGPFALATMGAVFGGTLRHHPRQAPTLAVPPYATAEEALARWRPEPEAHPGLRYFSESTRLLAQRYAGEVPVVGVLLSPVDLPIMLLGVEGWMETLLDEPDAARALLASCSAFCQAWGRQLLACGATVLGFTANFCNPGILPERIIRAFTLPELKAWCGGIPGPMVFHHGGCRLAPHLGLLGGLPQVAGYVFDPRDDLAEGRSHLGPGPLILGGLDGPGLERLTPEAAAAHCEQVLQERGADPRFILASGSADVALTTPAKVIEAVGQARLQWAAP
jgi:uroporphyrinogen decarboxylase